ncbi:MAG: cupin domain-containing protein [Spirosomataceae bacterium]
MKPATYWVETLHMQSHPEGGYFAETYRCAETFAKEGLPQRYSGARSFGTAIYFLLESHHFSSLHRIKSDEIWHFYAGCPLDVYMIAPTGDLTVVRLGSNPDGGEVFQAVVPAGYWFGAKPCHPNSYSLVGCTVAPGFDFGDFELARRDDLLAAFPAHAAVIHLLTA